MRAACRKCRGAGCRITKARTMNYYSTRDRERAHGCSLREAAMMGLAPDGGLFVPERIPQADMAACGASARRILHAALAGYLAGFVLRRRFRFAGRAAWWTAPTTSVPLRVVGRGRATLELVHGPTCAFKDFGAGFMGRMTGLLGAADETLVILTATSGDTGSAVAHGFHNVPGVEVVVLYPEGKISRLQECQMTALGGNIHPLRVAGTFDDCQRLVKELFADAPFRKRRRVTSANSDQLAALDSAGVLLLLRLYQWRQATGRRPSVVVVPSGNWKPRRRNAGPAHGTALRGFVAASNVNDVVPEFHPARASPPEAVSADSGQCDGCRRTEQFRTDAVALRRSGDAARAGSSLATMPRCRTIDRLYERHSYSSDRTAPSAMRPRRPWTSRVFTSPRRIPRVRGHPNR